MIEFLKASLVGGSLLAFALFGAATAGPLEDGAAAYAHGNYAAAMRLLRSPPANGSAEAQRDMGLCMPRVRVCSETSPRLGSGLAKPPAKGTSLRNIFWQ